MHRWFVVLLIVLLPWRAWAGDAMVLSMTAGPDHTVEPVGSMEVATPHCADHAVADLAAAALRCGAVRFASALSRPWHKPPIS